MTRDEWMTQQFDVLNDSILQVEEELLRVVGRVRAETEVKGMFKLLWMRRDERAGPTWHLFVQQLSSSDDPIPLVNVPAATRFRAMEALPDLLTAAAAAQSRLVTELRQAQERCAAFHAQLAALPPLGMDKKPPEAVSQSDSREES